MSRPVKALMAVGAVLAGTICVELTTSVPDHDNSSVVVSKSPLAQSASTGAIVAPPGRAALVDTILARPLFAPKRRPPLNAKSPAAPQTAVLPRLSGVITSGDQRTAIFAADEGQRPVVAALGEHVGQYTIQAIEHEKVTLVGPAGTRVLQPSFDPHPRPVEPTANAVAVQAPFANAAAVMPSVRNLAGFGGPPVGRSEAIDRSRAIAGPASRRSDEPELRQVNRGGVVFRPSLAMRATGSCRLPDWGRSRPPS